MGNYRVTVKRPQGRVYEEQTETGWESTGIVLTPVGIVWAHSNTYHDNGHTVLHYMHAGRLNVCSFDKYYRPRTLVTLAHRFAKEIAKC